MRKFEKKGEEKKRKRGSFFFSRWNKRDSLTFNDAKRVLKRLRGKRDDKQLRSRGIVLFFRS